MPARGWRSPVLALALPLAVAATAAPTAYARQLLPDLDRVDLSGAEPRVAAKIEALRRLALAQPDSAHAWGHLAMNLDVHGFDAEAGGAYARAATLDPADFRWRYYHAILRAEAGDPAADGLFRAAAEIQPGYAPLWVRHGDALLTEGEPDRARQAYETAASIAPGLLHPHLGLARTALAEGDPDAALAYASKAAEIDPASSEARGLLAETSRRLGWGEEARRQAELARNRPVRSPLEDPVYAALAAEGVSSFWHRRRGRALLDGGQYDAAEAELRQALQSAARAETHNDLGLALQRLGRPAEAVEQHRAALALRADYPEARQLLGLALADLGDLEGAIAELERAVELRPDLPGARLNLGTLRQRAGRDREAAELFRQAAAGEPADPRVLARLAWLLATSSDAGVRDGEEALALARRARELLPPDLPEALDVLAAALAEAGRFGPAVETAKRARELALRAERSDLARSIGERLALYRAGRAYREGAGSPRP